MSRTHRFMTQSTPRIPIVMPTTTYQSRSMAPGRQKGSPSTPGTLCGFCLAGLLTGSGSDVFVFSVGSSEHIYVPADTRRCGLRRDRGRVKRSSGVDVYGESKRNPLPSPTGCFYAPPAKHYHRYLGEMQASPPTHQTHEKNETLTKCPD